MDEKIETRKAVIGDLEAVKLLWKKLYEKEFEEFDDTADPEFSMTQKGDEFLRRRIEEDGFVAVAVDGEKIVGCLVGGIHDSEFYRFPFKFGEAETVFVEEEYRNREIGAKFLKMFEAWCGEKGLKRMRVVASFENKKAIKLYKREGFKEFDTVLGKVVKN